MSAIAPPVRWPSEIQRTKSAAACLTHPPFESRLSRALSGATSGLEQNAGGAGGADKASAAPSESSETSAAAASIRRVLSEPITGPGVAGVPKLPATLQRGKSARRSSKSRFEAAVRRLDFSSPPASAGPAVASFIGQLPAAPAASDKASVSSWVPPQPGESLSVPGSPAGFSDTLPDSTATFGGPSRSSKGSQLLDSGVLGSKPAVALVESELRQSVASPDGEDLESATKVATPKSSASTVSARDSDKAASFEFGARYRIRLASAHHGQDPGWYLNAQRTQQSDVRTHESTYVAAHRPPSPVSGTPRSDDRPGDRAAFGEEHIAGVWVLERGSVPGACRLRLESAHGSQEPNWYLDVHRAIESDRRDEDSSYVIVHRLGPADWGCAGDFALEPGSAPGTCRLRLVRGHFGQDPGWFVDVHRDMARDERDGSSSYVSLHNPQSMRWEHTGDFVLEPVGEPTPPSCHLAPASAGDCKASTAAGATYASYVWQEVAETLEEERRRLQGLFAAMREHLTRHTLAIREMLDEHRESLHTIAKETASAREESGYEQHGDRSTTPQRTRASVQGAPTNTGDAWNCTGTGGAQSATAPTAERLRTSTSSNGFPNSEGAKAVSGRLLSEAAHEQPQSSCGRAEGVLASAGAAAGSDDLQLSSPKMWRRPSGLSCGRSSNGVPRRAEEAAPSGGRYSGTVDALAPAVTADATEMDDESSPASDRNSDSSPRSPVIVSVAPCPRPPTAFAYLGGTCTPRRHESQRSPFLSRSHVYRASVASSAQAPKKHQKRLASLDFRAESKQIFQEAQSTSRLQQSLSRRVEIQRMRPWQQALYRITQGRMFAFVVASLIASNSVFMGLYMDVSVQGSFDTLADNPSDDWLIGHAGFCIAFAIELLMRLAAEQRLFVLGYDVCWNVFDSVCVIASIADLVFYSIDASQWDSSQKTIVAVVRCIVICRAVRLLRIVWHIPAFHNIRTMSHALVNSIPSFFPTLLVIALAVYIFSLFFMQGVVSYMERVPIQTNSSAPLMDGDENTSVLANSTSASAVVVAELQDHYGSLYKTFVTLFAAVSGGDDWAAIAKPLGELGFAYTYCFLAYLLLVLYGLLNVLSGVFVNVSLRSADLDRKIAMDKEIIANRQITAEMLSLFLEASSSRNGVLSFDEFEKFLETERVRTYFMSLDIDVTSAEKVFQLLTRSAASNRIRLREFVQACLRLRGPAKKIDTELLQALLHDQNQLILGLHERIWRATRPQGTTGVSSEEEAYARQCQQPGVDDSNSGFVPSSQPQSSDPMVHAGSADPPGKTSPSARRGWSHRVTHGAVDADGSQLAGAAGDAGIQSPFQAA